MRISSASAKFRFIVAGEVLVLSAAIPLLRSAPAIASTSTLTAVADSFTKSDAPSEVNGSSTLLRVDGSPVWNGYVKFNVPAGAIQTAKLRLTAASTTASVTSVKTSSSSWNEATLNYSNAPSPGATVGTIASVTSGMVSEVDVTSAVTSNSTVSFAITTASGTARNFNSREAATG